MLRESHGRDLLINIEVKCACLARRDLKPSASLSGVLWIQRQVGALLPDAPSGFASIEVGDLGERQPLQVLLRILAKALIHCILQLSQPSHIVA